MITPPKNIEIKQTQRKGWGVYDTENIKKGDVLSNIPPFVLEAGLEPARPQWSLDFKSNVSTNSTIRANKRAKDGI